MNIAHKIIAKLKRTALLSISDIHSNLKAYDYNQLNNKSHIVLTYHGVCTSNPSKYNSRFISSNLFEEHIKLFKKHFDIVDINEISIVKNNSQKLKIALTFDDGYHNNYTLAKPILVKHNVPATFCITGIIGEKIPILWTDYLDIYAKEYGRKITIDILETNVFFPNQIIG